MFDVTDLQAPEWGNKESGTRFVVDCLTKWTEALASYSGKSDQTSTKVSKVVETVKDTDPEAVEAVNEAMLEIRSILLGVLNENVNTSVLLFGELDEVKKAVGSYRQEVNVTVESEEDDAEDRDLIAEYEALDKGRTMIEGTFNAFSLDVMSLPEKFRAQKSERVNGKNVPTGEWMLKFPGKLTSPSVNENGSSGGFTRTNYKWTLLTADGEVNIGRSNFAYLARTCSSPDVLLSVDDLKTSIKARYGDNYLSNDKLEIRTPRGLLTGEKESTKK